MRTIVCLALATVISTSAVARDVAVCGASQGYGFYPKADSRRLTKQPVNGTRTESKMVGSR